MNHLRLFSLNGVWSAEAEVLSAVEDGQGGGNDDRAATWALDPLRRPRTLGLPGGDQPRVAPRTWMARVRVRSLELELPSPSSTDPEHLIIELAESAPALSCVLDVPETIPAPVKPKDTLDAVATAVELVIELGSGAMPPGWIDRVYLRGSTGTGNTRFSEVLSLYFDVPELLAGDTLLFDADGFAFRSRRSVPWWDPERARAGWFRYLIDRGSTSQPRYRLSVERSPAWPESLRRFQAQAISATVRVRDSDGMPSIDEPGAALSAAALPEDIAWHHGDNGWAFTLGSHVFEVEIRGVANAAARWAPASFEIDGDGLEIRARSSAPTSETEETETGALLTYSFDRSPAKNGGQIHNEWQGQTRLTPDPASLRSALGILGDSAAPRQTATSTWLLTETGALNLALPWPDNDVSETTAKSPELLRGAVTLGQVPWPTQNAGAGETVLAPDFGGLRGARLLIRDARSISATFRFSAVDQNIRLEQADLALHDPSLRANGLLLLYVPPAQARTEDFSGPPPMPRPHAGDGEAPTPFLDVPLRAARPEDAGGAHRFDLHIVFQPGRVEAAAEATEPREGEWNESTLDLTLSHGTAEQAEYWFRPAGMRWIPSLPWYTDPRRTPGERIAQERTYMPLRPVAGEVMTLTPGHDTRFLILRHGWFRSAVPEPDPGSRADLAAWVCLELPGMGFALDGQTPIRICDGRPAEGTLVWLVRSGLPLLDELHALRVVEGGPGEAKDTDEPAPAPVGQDWWQALVRLASLAQAERDTYVRQPAPLDEHRVLWLEDASVDVANLYARQRFHGLGSLDALAPSAAMDVLTPEAERVALIRSARLLEGPSARFAVEDRSPVGSPVLIPTNDPAAPFEIRAGCLVPQSLSGERGRLVLDQSGRVSEELGARDDLCGRRVFLPRDSGPGEEAPAGALTEYFQWSCRTVDLSSPVAELTLGFVALPLHRSAQGFRFEHDSPGAEDAVLRELHWYTVGPTRLWGLPFQIFRLDEVSFAASDSGRDPGLPDRIALTGVLHAREAAIAMADPQSQAVQVVFVRQGEQWSLDGLEGHVLWPLFETSPDLSDARREDLGDPLPRIEAPVELDRSSGPVAALRLGRDEEPANLLFRFLDRSFALPLDPFVVREAVAPGSTLHFTVQPTAEPQNLTLETIGGHVTLALDPAAIAASLLSFRANVARPAAPEHALAQLDLALELSPAHTGARLERLRFLVLSEDHVLAEVSRDAVGDVELSTQRISAAVTLGAGFRAPTPAFEILPGWPVEPQADLSAYLTLEITSPPASGRVASASIRRAHLVLETLLATPMPLYALLSFAVSDTGPIEAVEDVSIALTGQIRARSALLWSGFGGDEATLAHDVTFTLHQAILSGDRLDSTTDPQAFFAPRFSPEDEAGLAGMIELWCIAHHTLARRDDSEVLLSWTAPQRLRLASPRSFRQEILLRDPARAPEVLSVSKTPGRLRFQYLAATEEEQGFVGPLGRALDEPLAHADTMILEATDAFWIRPAREGQEDRATIELWRDRGLTMRGLPTRDTDFRPASDADAHDWVRLPMAFVTDTRGAISDAASADSELARLLESRPTAVGSGSSPKSGKVQPQTISRESLLHRSLLDLYSLRHSPLALGIGAPLDSVLLQPDAFTRLLPYVRPLDGFEPGWLTFHDWGTAQASDLGSPFAATADVLSSLMARIDTPPCLAATELVPEVRDGETSWQQVLDASGEPRPYLWPSPVLDLQITTTEPLGQAPAAAEREASPGRLVRILVELWLPAPSLRSAPAVPVLSARSVFYIGLSEHDTWRTILFDAPESPEGESSVRVAVRTWLKEHTNALDPSAALLLRARALSPDSMLPRTGYFLIPRSAPSDLRARSRRDPLSVVAPLRRDPRLTARTESPTQDPLWLGPDYLSGTVYYEPSTEIPGPTEEAPRVPVAGSAVGLAHKIAGTAPGPLHPSRLPRTEEAPGGHRWIEMIRDLMFEDRTRRDAVSRYEPGWLLPAARIPTFLDERARRTLHPFLGTRAVHIHTAGRPGELLRMRTALLLEEPDGALRRTASMAHEMRYPRPVPLPPALSPFDPTQEGNDGTARRNTCRVETSRDLGVTDLEPVPPFEFARLEWQDPVYNRRLLAVGQVTEGGGLTLVLDRSIYAGVDVLYPELRMATDDVDWTSIELTIAIQREQSFRLVTVRRMRYQVTWDHSAGSSRVKRVASEPGDEDGPDISARVVEPRDVARAPDWPQRWVWEIGLDQPEADDAHFDFELENQDQLWMEAILDRDGSRRRTHLSARVRTDLRVWPQPESAYAVLREQQPTPGEIRKEVSAFGWLPKPAVIKRENRFRPESWRGTFRHVDAYVPAASTSYEIVSVTSLGEQTGLPDTGES